MLCVCSHDVHMYICLCIGHGDLCQHGGRAGCVNLLQTVQERVKPRYHVFGHIHEGEGEPRLFSHWCSYAASDEAAIHDLSDGLV